MLNKNQEARFDNLFDKLVPNCGMAETLGGEIIRAVAKIAYRYYNDGDRAWEGYGRETVNPAVRFLMLVCDTEGENLNSEFVRSVGKLYNLASSTSRKEYEELIDRLAVVAVECVEERDLGERKNEYGDMLDCRNEEEDVDDYEEEEDDWDEEEEYDDDSDEE